MVTGKSLSEVFIYSSITPQYDNKLFNELRVQYKKITRAARVKNTNCFECTSKRYENLTEVSIVKVLQNWTKAFPNISLVGNL